MAELTLRAELRPLGMTHIANIATLGADGDGSLEGCGLRGTGSLRPVVSYRQSVATFKPDVSPSSKLATREMSRPATTTA